MKVVEHLDRASRPLISFEIIPPLRGGTLERLLELIDALQKFSPPFIDITSHSAEAYYEETRSGIQKRVKRKRPGTLGVCALIQNKYRIDAVPHLLCNGFSREETEDFLIELRYLGIDNVLAVRGDHSGYVKPLRDGRSANRYASDLVAQITAMNSGRYLEEDLLDADPSDFCIGVGGYPEKHFEAPNLETDVQRTLEKVRAGADYIVTQMFFDNRHYFAFVDRCRAAGIEVPIIPGLKILTTKKHLTSLPSVFHLTIPPELSSAVEEAAPSEVRSIGVDWALKQTEELLDHGVPAVHFYVMQSAVAIKELMNRLDL
ncbi:MAG: methylenetetrahydrofolate reductase [NAD(P)H] [Acidobacteria bacterium]|nr:MAG: methylenetetrahydrofolate reductase [NAD(P)H] [Acidobacteriota bacterium]REK10194.1 MAG: methylenetetrahydrofolate reductase [NAD(P)H] [Acidobacteriota bacterium]